MKVTRKVEVMTKCEKEELKYPSNLKIRVSYIFIRLGINSAESLVIVY